MGNWSLGDETLTIDDKTVPILEFTPKKLVYELADQNRTIIRVPIKRINPLEVLHGNCPVLE
jgi:hypothetical protein